jgi:prolipoprotein diacylglyceryltransferase
MLGLLFFLRKRGKYKWGITSSFYLIWYGVVRAILEPMREPGFILRIIPNGSNIVFNQVTFMLSIVFIILGVVLLILTLRGKISQENKACLRKTKTDT